MKAANSCVWSDGSNISNKTGMEVAKGWKTKQLEEVTNMICYKKSISEKQFTNLQKKHCQTNSE